MNEIILKRFENPDEIRNFEKGKFEIIKLNGMTIGPQPHDSWVVGDEEYVSLHFQGADKYAD